MGVPDLRGGFGSPTYYTTTEGVSARESETVVRVELETDGTIRTHLVGPRRPKDRSDSKVEITLHPDFHARRMVIRSPGMPAEFEVEEGRWSDWLRVKFKTGMFQTVSGIVRFHLIRLEPTFEFYASPVNFDPDAPMFPISHPVEYARELIEEIGPFHTTGMVEDHTGLNNERLGEEAFLDQCGLAWDEREAMMLHELERGDEGLFFCLFDTPDRVQHMFWRFREPGHPANHGAPIPPEMAGVIEDQYRRADSIVGRALEFADDDTLVVALSDHGFGSFRRGVHLNSWLYEHGLLALRSGVKPGEEAGDFLRGVDWSRTKAYALGLGGIYLNLEGREGQGIVKPADAERLRSEIASGLRGLQDDRSGQAAVRRVAPREELYTGPFAAESPDLVVNFASGYRVSWGTSLGGVAEGLFEDNVKKWSGDHIVDPVLVPGILFLNRPFRGECARLVDLAPTIIDALGVPKSPAMEGSSLLS
jgi:predicted AlkP superfamily phosphohydrolase/phosphomutase